MSFLSVSGCRFSLSLSLQVVSVRVDSLGALSVLSAVLSESTKTITLCGSGLECYHNHPARVQAVIAPLRCSITRCNDGAAVSKQKCNECSRKGGRSGGGKVKAGGSSGSSSGGDGGDRFCNRSEGASASVSSRLKYYTLWEEHKRYIKQHLEKALSKRYFR